MRYRTINAALAVGLIFSAAAWGQNGCQPRRAATLANCKTVASWKDGLKDFSAMVNKSIADQREASAVCPKGMSDAQCETLKKAADDFAASFRKDADKAILHAAWLLDKIDVTRNREAVEGEAGAIGDNLAQKLQTLDGNFRSAIVGAISAKVEEVNQASHSGQ